MQFMQINYKMQHKIAALSINSNLTTCALNISWTVQVVDILFETHDIRYSNVLLVTPTSPIWCESIPRIGRRSWVRIPHRSDLRLMMRWARRFGSMHNRFGELSLASPKGRTRFGVRRSPPNLIMLLMSRRFCRLE